MAGRLGTRPIARADEATKQKTTSQIAADWSPDITGNADPLPSEPIHAYPTGKTTALQPKLVSQTPSHSQVTLRNPSVQLQAPPPEGGAVRSFTKGWKTACSLRKQEPMNHLFHRRDRMDLTFDSNLSVYFPPFGRFTFRPLIAVSPDKIHPGAIADSPHFVTSETCGAELVNAGLPRSNGRVSCRHRSSRASVHPMDEVDSIGPKRFLPHGSNGSG